MTLASLRQPVPVSSATHAEAWVPIPGSAEAYSSAAEGDAPMERRSACRTGSLDGNTLQRRFDPPSVRGTISWGPTECGLRSSG